MSNRASVKELKQIIQQIIEINNSLGKKTTIQKENYFFDKHPDIMNNYPFLVSQICSGGDLSMLDRMLVDLEQIEKGQRSKEEVDTTLGKDLATKYIDPKL